MAYTAKDFEKLITAQETAQQTDAEKVEKQKRINEAAAKEGARIKAEKELLGPRR